MWESKPNTNEQAGEVAKLLATTDEHVRAFRDLTLRNWNKAGIPEDTKNIFFAMNDQSMPASLQSYEEYTNHTYAADVELRNYILKYSKKETVKKLNKGVEKYNATQDVAERSKLLKQLSKIAHG